MQPVKVKMVIQTQVILLKEHI